MINLDCRYINHWHEQVKQANFCQDDTLSSQTLDFVDGGHLDRENDTLESQVLCKTYRECSGNVKGMFREDQGKFQSSSQSPILMLGCQDDPLSSSTPFPDIKDGRHLEGENETLESHLLGKSCLYNGDCCLKLPTFCQDDTLILPDFNSRLFGRGPS